MSFYWNYLKILVKVNLPIMWPLNAQVSNAFLQLHFRIVLFVWLLGQTRMWRSTFQRRIRMKKKQQQIRCSSDASIAGRTDSPLQVTRLFCLLQCLNQPLLHPILSMSPALFLSSVFSKLCPLSSPDSGSSSSEDEGPNRQQSGQGARNGDVRRKRSRTPSPRRRPRGLSPRSALDLNRLPA